MNDATRTDIHWGVAYADDSTVLFHKYTDFQREIANPFGMITAVFTHEGVVSDCDECDDQPPTEAVESPHEWPNNGLARLVEDQALIEEVATIMMGLHTPHAISCGDKNCEYGKNLTNNEWSRYYALEDHVLWLRHKALKAVLENRIKIQEAKK